MNRAEVWLINLDPTMGAEIRKTRPAVIVNDDAIGILPLRVIVPITEWNDQYTVAPWLIRLEPNTLNGLKKRSAADTFQIRSVSQKRLIQKMGLLSDEEMREIARALTIVLSIEMK